METGYVSILYDTKDTVSEELSSVETQIMKQYSCWVISLVSEELSSVETFVVLYILHLRGVVSEELSSVETDSHVRWSVASTLFQKNLVVWKLEISDEIEIRCLSFRRT